MLLAFVGRRRRLVVDLAALVADGVEDVERVAAGEAMHKQAAVAVA